MGCFEWQGLRLDKCRLSQPAPHISVFKLVPQFAPEHPGGAKPIYRAAGTDASHIFNPMHPPGTIENGLDVSAFVGLVDPATIKEVTLTTSTEPSERIDLAEIIGLPDFDEAAHRMLTPKAWAYMSAGATQEHSECDHAMGPGKMI